MTEYETQSLQIATNTYYVYLGGLVVAFLAGCVAFWTLRKIAQQLESAKWNALLSFEQDMNARRHRFSEISQKLASSSEPAKHEATFNEAKESYLNAVERLAASILKGQFPEDEMKTSYREYIASTIREYEDKFGAGTHYPRVIELHKKWRD
jgi:hypothetical protein